MLYLRFYFKTIQITSVKDQINRIYNDYVEELIGEATQQVNEILLPLRRLHLGLPESQENVAQFSSGRFVCVSRLCTQNTHAHTRTHAQVTYSFAL